MHTKSLNAENEKGGLMASIFVCLEDQQHQHKLLETLESQFEGVSGLVNWEDLPDLNKQDHPGISLILITDTINETLQNLVSQLKSPCTIVLYSRHSFEETIGWFQKLPLRNLILQTADDFPEFSLLISSLRKIVTQDIFGIEKNVSGDIRLIQKRLQCSDERYDLKDELSLFIEPKVHNVKIKRAVLAVLEELVMNAFYNAPVDENSHPLFAEQDQTIPVQLPIEKNIEINYGLDDNYLIVSVRDPYGSFQDTFLIDSLNRHFEGRLTIREGKGGAGLGLVKLFRSLSHLVVNIEAGQQTEFIAFINLGIQYNKFLRQSRSLNIFVK